MLWLDPDETNGSCSKPGIYRFTLDEGIYIGRFTHANRPLAEYRRNVQKLIDGRPYRPKSPDGFRFVHRALYRAVTGRQPIFLEIVENAEPSNLDERERFWIAQVPPEKRLNGPRKR